MEKAILKTLIYADIFDYPLKINEIHRWLIGRKVTLRQIAGVLAQLNQEARIVNQGEYFCLKGRNILAGKRRRKEKQSAVYLRKAKIVSQILKLIPWVKLVGISGGLAVNNAGKSDDIDLFIIASKDKLWISRFLCLGLLSFVGQRRKRQDRGKKIAGKICVNVLLEEDKLKQKSKDIFIAHEVLQMRPLWQRDGIYSRYLEENAWVFKFLPNWINLQNQKSKMKNQNYNSKFKSFDLMEKIAKWLQLKIMQKPKGMERIEDGALYFHPEDCRRKVLSEYKKGIRIISP